MNHKNTPFSFLSILFFLFFLSPVLVAQTFPLPNNQWHQISLPSNPGANSSVEAVFGDDELGVYGNDWLIYRYDTGTDKYEELATTDTLNQGVGYWIIQRTGSEKTLSMPAGSTPTPTSNPAGCPSGNCFPISLGTESSTKQWNMIGYPFDFSQPLNNSRVVTTSATCGSGCSIDDAKDNGVFHNQLWNYNGTDYTLVDSTSGSLNPWLAYWSATLSNADGKNPSLLIPKETGNTDCSIFPADNPWNQDISALPVHPNSAAYMSSIGSSGRAHADFGTVWNGAPNGIPFVEVNTDTPRQNVQFQYADESDQGPYPIPNNPPIEGGPNGTGDRHIIMLDRNACKLYELFATWPPGQGDNPNPDSWYAGSGAIFDLNTNNLRPDFWTSADAAGLPIYPGLVTYEEVMVQKEIRHALRFTADTTQRAFIRPATHFASSSTDANLPPMGLRVRLKANFDISGFSAEIQVILTALKKYGMLLADNGSDWFISGAPDSRWSDDNLAQLHDVPGSAFEAVMTGELITR